MNEVVREWPANEATARALRIAVAERKLVSAELVYRPRRNPVVRVVLRPAVLSSARAKPRRNLTTNRRTAKVAIASTAALLLLGAIVWLVVLAVSWATAHVAQILGVLGGGAVLLYLAGRVGVCPGVHCPGCRHR